MNIEQLYGHLKKLVESLSAKQLVGLAAVFVAVVGVVVGSAYWINEPQYSLLIADMDAETANSVITKLKTDKVLYRIGDGGRSVSVPSERADELRLQFASGGLPSAGRIGFEIFDRTAFGTTEFLEHINYRRALEGELARTIGTLSEVASARVHIAMAKDSLFVNQAEPAKATVVLKLKARRPLAPGTVRGIAGLVAASVESLRPESVVILDADGRELTKPAEDSSAGGAINLDKQQQVERALSERVIALLEPVVGSGRVRVNVAAVLKADLVEETEERWDPTSVVRSRQISSETGSAASNAGGVAGARANQPAALSTATPAAATTSVAPAGPGRTAETTNYEVSKLTRHTVTPQGQLARLSVAVILDDERQSAKAADGTVTTSTKPWEPAGIERIQGLVAAAVGLDTERGDKLTVENIAFDSQPEAPEPPKPTFMQQLTEGLKNNWPTLVRLLAIVLLGSFALFGVLRPLMRRATGGVVVSAALPAAAAAGGPAGARLPTVQEMEGQIEAELDAAAAANQARRLPVLTQRVVKLANEEPEQVARIMRGWMSEEEKK